MGPYPSLKCAFLKDTIVRCIWVCSKIQHEQTLDPKMKNMKSSVQCVGLSMCSCVFFVYIQIPQTYVDILKVFHTRYTKDFMSFQ